VVPEAQYDDGNDQEKRSDFDKVDAEHVRHCTRGGERVGMATRAVTSDPINWMELQIGAWAAMRLGRTSAAEPVLS